jgi:signal transduction histidine kinase
VSRSGDRRGPRLSLRIFFAMVLVVLAGATTMILVSLLLAPAIFHRHLDLAGVAPTPEAARHVDEGFATAALLSTAAGVAAALAVATAGAYLVAGRIGGPVADIARATGQLAAGDYSVRVTEPRMGPELADLADAVNALADRLETTEAARIRLMADLAHQLRTPVAAIEATAQAVADGVLPVDETTTDTLTAQAQRLARLVDDLAAVSRAQERAFTLRLVGLDLAGVARGCAGGAAARYARAGITLRPPVGPGVQVLGDPDRLGEVIDQLLDNALHHCTSGDTVTLDVRGTGDAAELTVTDSGAGFDPADAERIFDRFHRADPSRQHEGSGIGLTIARALVTAHGGTLTAASGGPGHGATITLRLPRRSD